jgi:hypothetical protein
VSDRELNRLTSQETVECLGSPLPVVTFGSAEGISWLSSSRDGWQRTDVVDVALVYEMSNHSPPSRIVSIRAFRDPPRNVLREPHEEFELFEASI